MKAKIDTLTGTLGREHEEPSCERVPLAGAKTTTREREHRVSKGSFRELV